MVERTTKFVSTKATATKYWESMGTRKIIVLCQALLADLDKLNVCNSRTELANV